MVPTSTRSQRLGLLGLTLSLALLGLSGCGSEGVGAPGRGRALYDSCLPCHGSDLQGQEHLAAPAIAGMAEWYVKEQLQNFQTAKRGFHHSDLAGQRMRPMARTLRRESDIDAIAKFVAEQPVVRPAPTVTGGDADKGKEAYQVCVACHGVNGEGQPALHAPSLTKTHDWYLLTQLKHYRHDRRGTVEGDIWGATMRGTSLTLDEPKMLDLIAYIHTLGHKE